MIPFCGIIQMDTSAASPWSPKIWNPSPFEEINFILIT
jgi:hypothetical protein